MPRSLLSSLIGLFIFAILLLAHSWHGPDIWYHLTWGRELVSAGHWIPETHVVFAQPIPANGYWLFQSLMYLVYSAGGLWAVSGLFALVWLLTMTRWIQISGLYRRSWGPILYLAALICVQLRFEQRPEAFSYLFLTAMIWFVLRAKLWPLFVIQILWTNTHGYFVLGPAVAGLAMLSAGQSWRKSSLLALGLFASTLITPFGPGVWVSVFNYARFGAALKDLNHELMPPEIWPLHWTMAVFWASWILTLMALIINVFRRENLPASALAAVGLVLSAQASRNIPLLFLLSPLLWRHVRFEWRRLNLCGYAVSGVSLILAVSVWLGDYHRWTGSLSTFGVKLEWASYPIGAVESLQQAGFKGRLYCDSYDGGFLEYHLPEVTIAGDSYFADPKSTRSFFAAIKDPRALAQLEETVSFDGYLVNIENSDVIEYLLQKTDQVIAYADSHRILFLPRSRNPQFTGELSGFSFYHGENLRHWAYEFGVVAWMDLAYRHQWTPVMFKILSDISTSDYIPRAAFGIALKYASDHRDQNLLLALAPLKDRVHD